MKNESSQEARAMVFEQPQKPFRKSRFDLPTLGDSEALIRITYTTICTSDLHTYYGKRISPTNSILGHEIIGEIAQMPQNGLQDFYGQELKIGDVVTWSIYAHDQVDKYVQMGIPQKAKSLFKYGHQKIDAEHPLSGGFATYCHLKKGSTIFKIPSNLSSKEAAPLNCTHATMAGAIRLAGAIKDKNVMISGAGMLGLSAYAMAKEAGANLVLASDINPDRLKNSKLFGVDKIMDAQTPLAEQLEYATSFGGIDVVLETSGVPAAIENTSKLLNIGGVMVLVGSVFTQRDIAINAEQIVRRLLTIKGLHNYIHEDLGTAIKFLAANHQKYPFESLVGQEYHLSDLDHAFEFAHHNECYRVGVRPNEFE